MKCEICRDHGYYFVTGLVNEPFRFDCECNQKPKQVDSEQDAK